MNENGPTGIEVEQIFGPIAVCSCLGPLVFHM